MVVVAISLYKTEAEKQQHLSAIFMLARELGVGEESVKLLYEKELQALHEHAQVRTFLSVLVSRSVKDKILERVFSSM